MNSQRHASSPNFGPIDWIPYASRPPKALDMTLARLKKAMRLAVASGGLACVNGWEDEGETGRDTGFEEAEQHAAGKRLRVVLHEAGCNDDRAPADERGGDDVVGAKALDG